MSGRGKAGLGAAVFLIVLLLGAFVVYPAIAAPKAQEKVEDGIQSVAQASGVKLENVVVEVSGSNAFSALFSGKQVGDISVRIGKIVLPAGATQGEAPEVTSGQEQKAADGVRDVLDAIESVGSFEVAIGDIVSGNEKLALNYSSFELSDGTYRMVLRVPKSEIDKVLRPIGVTLDLVADGSTISGSIALGESGGEDSIKQDFKVDIKPVDEGRAIQLALDGAPPEKFELGPDGGTITELGFSTAGGVYEIAVGGTYDYEALRADIEKELNEFEQSP